MKKLLLLLLLSLSYAGSGYSEQYYVSDPLNNGVDTLNNGLNFDPYNNGYDPDPMNNGVDPMNNGVKKLNNNEFKIIFSSTDSNSNQTVTSGSFNTSNTNLFKGSDITDPKAKFNRSRNSNANWQRLGENSSATHYLYLDNETINQDSNGYVYFWSMANLYKKNSDGSNSIEVYVKTNCNTNQLMILKENRYKKNMAKGNPFKSINVKREWASVSSESIQHWASEHSCFMMDLYLELSNALDSQ